MSENLFPNTTRIAKEAGSQVLSRMDGMVRAMICTQSKLIKEADARLGQKIWIGLYTTVQGRSAEAVQLVMEDRIKHAMSLVKSGGFKNDRESMILLMCMDMLLGFFYDNFYTKLKPEDLDKIDEALKRARMEKKTASI